MMQITEDTPPDMLAGAMDLTVHLPTGRTVKMSVERSTPMMDLLVQITTAHHFQHSGHILQALELAPSSAHTDKVLPYKPNTPIGALDTQHVKVIPKNRPVSAPKNTSTGHQPFESTFRLQVHLPRNQLYVIRVSQNVYLGDIMKKVCDEKNLDTLKYEFRHPGNLDEVLDPKLTLSDYQITEVYIVAKGTVGLTQAFSSSDIMALRKEEERKQLQARTCGGVFSLIFKRGKTSMGSGSVSSDNRSISPSHSDDSRSLTPPGTQQQILAPAPAKEPEPPTEKPKAPQRKRRPAPKPPQQIDNRKESTDKPPSQISSGSDNNTSDLQQKKIDNGLTICHSRNSSDSSGYHEPSVLSDNCNTSLPRRPKSTLINEVVREEPPIGENTRCSTGNLTKMALLSKSTTSITSRKKKAAPPPPPVVIKTETPAIASDKPSLVTASPPVEPQVFPKPTARNKVATDTPKPTPRVKPVVVENPIPQARKSITLANYEDIHPNEEGTSTNQRLAKTYNIIHSTNEKLIEQLEIKMKASSINPALVEICKSADTLVPHHDYEEYADVAHQESAISDHSSDMYDDEKKLRQINSLITKKRESFTSVSSLSSDGSVFFDTVKSRHEARIINSKQFDDETQSLPDEKCNLKGQEVSGNYKCKYRVSISLDDDRAKELKVEDLMPDSQKVVNWLGTEAKIPQTGLSITSLEPEMGLKTDVTDNVNLGRNKWALGDSTETDSISTFQTKSPTESVTLSNRPSITASFSESITHSETSIPIETITPHQKSPPSSVNTSKTPSKSESRSTTTSETNSRWSSRGSSNSLNEPIIISTTQPESPLPDHVESRVLEKDQTDINHPPDDLPSFPQQPLELTKLENDKIPELESDWQYQLPSPPTAFRDSSPTNLTDITNYDTITLQEFKDDSVVTNPELFEKLKRVKDSQCETETISDLNSIVSDEDKPMLSTLSLESLEKRQSLVYNRELSTSLKIAHENVLSGPHIVEASNTKRSSVLSELEEVIQNGGSKSLSRHNSTVEKSPVIIDSSLPNFKISAYDNPKRKINIFEDESVRSNVFDNSFKASSFLDLTGTKDDLSNNNNNTSSFSCIEDNSMKKANIIGQSLENVSYRKTKENNTDEELFKKPQDFSKYKSLKKNNFYVKHSSNLVNNVARSESFCSNNNERLSKPHNPVQRSKSQIALNKYRNEEEVNTETESHSLAKSNSLFDVSGLQSLEVIRMIQNKLNTPSNSVEQLDGLENNLKESEPIPKTESETTSTKTYRYQGPPAINLSTWSERPKTKVSLKEDTDYKINKDHYNSKVKLNASNIQFRNTNGYQLADTNNVSVKINGTESITSEESGNVVIKIGDNNPCVKSSIDNFSSRFITHTTAVGYRKPLGNINKIEKGSRPHSIALDSNFDISRVPIVRSVELKKTFVRESQPTTNTSVTQLNGVNELNGTNNKFTDIYRSTEAINEINSLKHKNSSVYLSSDHINKPVVGRVNSFVQQRAAPIVIGFKGDIGNNDNTARSRKSWNVPNTYSTLPLNLNPESTNSVRNNSNVNSNSFIPNTNVPFSQLSLKRRVLTSKEHSSCEDNVINNNVFGNVMLRNTSLSKRCTSNSNSNNNRYSTGSSFGGHFDVGKRYPNEVEFSGGAPPPPPLMPKVNRFTKKAKSLEPIADSRDELLSSIRNFGGTNGLRNVKG